MAEKKLLSRAEDGIYVICESRPYEDGPFVVQRRHNFKTVWNPVRAFASEMQAINFMGRMQSRDFGHHYRVVNIDNAPAD